jgi:hypothetical protein
MVDFFFGELKNSFNYKVPEDVLQRFSWRRCAEQTLEVYSTLCKKAGELPSALT